MGIYLNPGNENFKSMVSGDIYVDKTMMLEVTDRFIDKGNKYVCVSRPRRFGKTIAGNMLAAYYSKGCDSAKLFSQYKIAGTPVFGQKMNRYNVIKIDMNSEYQMIDKKEDMLKELTYEIREELNDAFPRVNLREKKRGWRATLYFVIIETKNASGGALWVIMSIRGMKISGRSCRTIILIRPA